MKLHHPPSRTDLLERDKLKKFTGKTSPVWVKWLGEFIDALTVTAASLGGAVFGPAGAVDNDIAVFDGTTGELIKDSGTTLASIAAAIALKVTANGAISGATKTKITYDAKGLVTAGADAVLADLAATTADFSMNSHKLTNVTDPASAQDAATKAYVDATKIIAIEVVIDGGGAAITTGIKVDVEIPFACTINRVTMLADQSGSIVVDIWKDTYANYPPLVGDSITASAKPTITTATKSQDATLTGWTTSVAAGDTLRFNVDSVTTIERVTLSLKVTKT